MRRIVLLSSASACIAVLLIANFIFSWSLQDFLGPKTYSQRKYWLSDSLKSDRQNRLVIPPSSHKDGSKRIWEMNKSDKLPEMNKSDKPSEINESDKLPEMNKSDKPSEINESDKLPEMNKSDKSPEMNKSNKSPEMDKLDKLPEMDKSNKSPEMDKSNKSPEMDKPDKLPEMDKSSKSSETKLILAYTTLYGNPFTTKSYGRVKANPFSQCKYKCSWSNNKADYNRSDAVIFHLYNLSPIYKGAGYGEFVISKLPTRYRRDQKWVLMIREPNSFFYPQQLKLLDDKFNLSMTFQSDSDVVIPYGRYWKLSKPEKYANIDYITGKSKMVAWLVSNCITSSRREDYVRELQKYIQVDVYGNCPSFNSSKATGHSFITYLSKKYKFYLAFENSDCEDYITEKFWETLSLGMIPIVRSQRVDYKRLAPPNSYIHTDWFNSPQQLAQYLKDTASQTDALQKYHQWRKSYQAQFRVFFPRWYCGLCEKVHTSPSKTVDVYKHFSEDTRCNVFDRNRDRTGEHMQNIEF